MIVWLWEAMDPGKFLGVSDTRDRAQQLATEYMASGQAEAAMVEEACVVLDRASLQDFYLRTGHGWTARRGSTETGWRPFHYEVSA